MVNETRKSVDDIVINQKKTAVYKVTQRKEQKKLFANSDPNHLIRIFKEKTGGSFDNFYKKHLPKLSYHLHGLCHGNSAIAEDITILSMYKGLEKIEDYDPKGANIATWIYTIAKNEAKRLRAADREYVSFDHVIDDNGSTFKDIYIDKTELDVLEEDYQEMLRERANLVINEIYNLEEPLRSVMIMREIDGLSYRALTLKKAQRETILVSGAIFESEYYCKETKVLTLVDNEVSIGGKGLTKFLDIEEIIDVNDVYDVNYVVISRDKDNLIEAIRITYQDSFYITGTTPFNMSTIKSQIRNARARLQSNLAGIENE